MRALLAVALAGWCGAAAAEGYRLNLGLRHEAQHWRETGAAGTELLRERGPLSGFEAGLQWQADEAWQARVSLAALAGTRDYQGQTQRGAAVQSRSDLRDLRLRLGWEWRPAAQPMLVVGVGGEALQWHRGLRSVAQAAGYPERYRLGLLSMGIGLEPLPQWRGWFEVGAGSGGSNRVILPGRDPADLPLGRSTLLRTGLAWQATPAWRAELAWDRLRIAAGEVRPIAIQGVVVQAANQPRSELGRWALSLSWTPALPR